jgi:hypothetical protein
MNPTFIDNGNGTFSEMTTVPFDPVATANEIVSLQTQMAAASALAASEAQGEFESQITTLITVLTAAAQALPSIAAIPAVAAILAQANPASKQV